MIFVIYYDFQRFSRKTKKRQNQVNVANLSPKPLLGVIARFWKVGGGRLFQKPLS
jgi:hypothetical protein